MSEIEKITAYNDDGVETATIDVHLESIASKQVIGTVKDSEGNDVEVTQITMLSGMRFETITPQGSLINEVVDTVEVVDNTLGEGAGGLLGGFL